MSGGWRPTRSLGRGAAVGVLALVAGAVAGRADLAVVGVPLLAAAVWAVATHPRATPTVRCRVGEVTLREGGTTTWRVDVDPVPGLREVLAHLPGSRWAPVRPAHGHVAATVTSAAEAVPVAVEVTPTRWGRHPLGPAQVVAVGDLAGYVWTWPVQRTEEVGVLPNPGTFTSRATLPHPVGLVGAHRSTRPGSGTELADIRPFRTGDRLRRIHWPVSLRAGELHVTTSHADEDAEVRIVLDAVRDLGTRDPATGRVSCLDVAVEAAGAVAAHYLGTGDRVGLSVLGGGLVEVPAVGGHHQLERILSGLSRTRPSTGTIGEDRTLRAQLNRPVPPGAVVVLMSSLVAAAPLARAVRLARTGHVVIVVDTLPPALAGPAVTAEEAAAASGVEDPRAARVVWRLRMLDREREVRRCAAAGVPVVPWRGAGSLDAVLRGTSRRGRAPRAVRR
ncbi:DUF58 domain-containing protein [Phycicoccus sp. BSK3Z-2]|uniref:DUF58 domain-containing protein n=1 Tax=Phycicoccus avicenniae TaxID=2828860 RepID=A0A941DAH6_9MICO|nr:DUF58 domain-containing protein [Phycicoccus avicenniae]MBR7742842.1 DUF58 domain-containing protein [Phycicoccus avicenniae]